VAPSVLATGVAVPGAGGPAGGADTGEPPGADAAGEAGQSVVRGVLAVILRRERQLARRAARVRRVRSAAIRRGEQRAAVARVTEPDRVAARGATAEPVPAAPAGPAASSAAAIAIATRLARMLRTASGG
jgi:hypothetical protein